MDFPTNTTALINDRAAFFQVKLGRHAEADNYFARSMELY
jgi:hypothetical protein